MRCSLSLLLMALGLVLGAGAAAAPCPEVRREIDLTDARLARAGTAVSAANNNAEARRDLALATDFQARSRLEIGAGRCLVALDFTRRARLRALHAVSLVRGLPDPDRIRVQLERSREILDRSREQLRDCDEIRAQSILRAAVQMQERAEAAFAADPPRVLASLQLTVSARERAQRALRLCHLEESIQASAEHALGRTDEVIGRAREKAGESTAAPGREPLARASEIQTRARDEYRAGHFEASLRLTQEARAFAFRSLRLAGTSS